MKTKLPTHIDNWSFKKEQTSSFLENYDVFILIILFAIAYFVLF